MAEDLTPDLAGNDYGPSLRAVGTDLSHQAHATFTNMASDCPGRDRHGGSRCCTYRGSHTTDDCGPADHDHGADLFLYRDPQRRTRNYATRTS